MVTVPSLIDNRTVTSIGVLTDVLIDICDVLVLPLISRARLASCWIVLVSTSIAADFASFPPLFLSWGLFGSSGGCRVRFYPTGVLVAFRRGPGRGQGKTPSQRLHLTSKRDVVFSFCHVCRLIADRSQKHKSTVESCSLQSPLIPAHHNRRLRLRHPRQVWAGLGCCCCACAVSRLFVIQNRVDRAE